MVWKSIVTIYLTALLIFSTTEAKIHRISLRDDARTEFLLSTFGYIAGATLKVNVTNLHYVSSRENDAAFVIALIKNNKYKGGKDEVKKYCAKEITKSFNSTQSLILIPNKNIEYFDILKPAVLEGLKVCDLSHPSRTKRETGDSHEIATNSTKVNGYPSNVDDPNQVGPTLKDEFISSTTTPSAKNISPGMSTSIFSQSTSTSSSTTTVPLVTDKSRAEETCDDNKVSLFQQEKTFPINFSFLISFSSENDDGSYDLMFFNCFHQNINLTLTLEEHNPGSYLSAGEKALPTVYLVLAVVYAFVAVIWACVLQRAKSGLFKTHYLMLVVVITKSLALLLNGLHYYFTGKNGHHEDAFAILYYIIYLLRGSLMLITILLIGAGWTFIKYAFSDREKKVFIIIIPLQILANIANIIMDETEEASSQYSIWKEAFILLDLLCCGAILFPVVWSIRHLQEAANTDGKAAINLQKLQIFRHFYILIVCYIYFSRIIVYLLQMTLPYKYEWLYIFFQEVATLIFYFVTGYKFRPESENPYLQLPQEDEDDEEETVLSVSGVYENVIRVNIKDEEQPGQTETQSGLKVRESSHEYD